MKTRFLLTVINVILTNTFFCQSSWSWDEYTSTFRQKKNTKSIIISETKVDDVFGEIVESGVSNYVSYTYNDNRQLVELRHFTYPISGNMSASNIFSYDDKGNVASIEFKNLGWMIKHIYKYNSANDKTQHNVYNESGVLLLSTTYTYNDIGNLIEVIESNDKASITKRETHIYDNNSNQIEKKIYKYLYKENEYGHEIPYKTYIHTHTFTYNTQGKLIEENISDDSDRSVEKITFKYGSLGNCIEKLESSEFTDQSGRTIQKFKAYKYNDYGNLIEERELHNNDVIDIHTYKYEFDDKGNWVKKTSFKNNIPGYIYEQKIEYFEE